MSAFGSTSEFGTAELPGVSRLSLSCEPAGFVLAGKAAAAAAVIVAATATTALAAQPITAPIVAGSARAVFTLAAQPVQLPLTQPSATSAFVLSGRAAQQARITEAAAFVVSSPVSDLPLRGVAGAASFALIGQIAQQAMPAAAASLTMQGQAQFGAIRLPVDGMAYSLFGKPVFRAWAIGLNIPGEAATAEYGTAEYSRNLTYGTYASAASFALVGENALLTTAPVAVPFVVTPGSADMAMAVSPAGFATAGQDVRTALTMAGQPRALVLSGQSIALLALESTSFALVLQAVRMYASPEAGAFLLQGQNAFQIRGFTVGPTSFALNGQASFVTALNATVAPFNVLGWSIVDVTGPTGDHSYLVEVQAHDGTSIRTFYLSTDGFTSQPYDEPANQYYEPRIIDPGNFERSLFEGAALRGRGRAGHGDIRLASGDPGNGETLDDWLTYGWSQRQIRIKSLPRGARSLSAAATLFVGRLDRVTSTKPLEYLDLKISDRLADLQRPLITTLFAGTTTSSGATAEGNSDLKGKIKQRCWGFCSNVPLQSANPYDLIYLASNGAVHAIVVKDGGVALTSDGDVANLAALQAASVAGGHYRTCLALGLVKIGAVPAKTLTADVTEGANAAQRTAGQIVYRMLLSYGIPSNTISVGSIAVLDTRNSAECCYFVDDNREALAAVQDVLDSIGAWMVPNNDGTLIFGRHEAPALVPMATFDLEEASLGDSISAVEADIPAWRVLLEWGPIFTVQNDGDLLGTVDAERRAYLAKQFRTVAAEDTAIKTKHLNAREVTIRTHLTDGAAAATEVARQLALQSVQRQRYDMKFPLSDAWGSVPGNSISLRHPRLGLASGKAFNVLKRVDQYADDTVEFSLWG